MTHSQVSCVHWEKYHLLTGRGSNQLKTIIKSTQNVFIFHLIISQLLRFEQDWHAWNESSFSLAKFQIYLSTLNSLRIYQANFHPYAYLFFFFFFFPPKPCRTALPVKGWGWGGVGMGTSSVQANVLNFISFFKVLCKTKAFYLVISK